MDKQYSSQLTMDNLDLEKKPLDKFPARLYLQTSEKVANPKSFVFLPVYLVDTLNNEPMIYDTIKREIIFSKMIEYYMENILTDLKKYEIRQVYYIPLSGFLRVMNTAKEKTHYEYYKDSFKGMLIFADRPYFREAFNQKVLFRRSNPYIDTGGFGVVITYSIIIKNEKLGVMGMIGVDRQLDIKTFLEKTRVGFPSFGRDYRFDYYPVSDKKSYEKNFADEKLRYVISEIVNKSDKQFARKIGKENESSAFTFKINEIGRA
ncbi:MAG: hypothetical protein QG657_4064, partial [Acidobacteriota bacterium]|nr:hypothetical protein [Acidobacteriota bacterium]